MMEFHIARSARTRYAFDQTLFSFNGNVVFANMPACRAFAYRMNQVRNADLHPDEVVHAGKLYAMGLIDEASHVLVARYRELLDPAVMTSALGWFGQKVGTLALDELLETFVELFPGQSVLQQELTPAQWLAEESEGEQGSTVQNRAVALEELLMLHLENRNPAFKPFAELFDESQLRQRTVYKQLVKVIPDYFATRPLIPLENAEPVTLYQLLSAPADGAPESLQEQLKLIQKLWRPLLGASMDRFLELAAEILREEELAIWMQFHPAAAAARTAADEAARLRRERGEGLGGGPVATAEVPTFGDPAHEYEKFSPDQAWMPTAVLLAKSTYVWLAQLSRQHGRHIGRLDEIPEEELETLARRGINTLWLIGVWERSRASKTIKQLCGNHDAVASAYSLFDYRIADDLGGEAAYIALRDRAYRHGVRLASDMVPNHMGIDSPWVVEHPDWFVSRWESPYPAYSFNGPDLSSDGRVELKIEDHYYSQTDAAVVFRRVDKASGETRYIYHGNDGTSFPWNDTAQLDYMNRAVREQVIQTILHVARLFPVIRFDAAMTLAKRHFHRLWFPGPGASGAIPSRAEYGMSQQDFDRAMPEEFWREVVDRVAAEVPGTLLLAEAFWLMEGYFVRTLGMHRVYNSAFMVMLRDEENAKYRSVIKNTIEFDADILKRYVNFMSNPDERTAIDQFGKGDKCFGVAVMMSTLPGLPMFGHGQVEGFTEKYGMEYRWPRYQENADPWLVERHQHEIAPLLERRWLFAESENFLLYDFFEPDGRVNEDVFAYSNRTGSERALVIFQNRYATAEGGIHNSAAYADKAAGGLRRRQLADGLGLSGDKNAVLRYRDSLTGLEYLKQASDVYECGLQFRLNAYECHVFVDWCELKPSALEPWHRLCDALNGRGVRNLQEALLQLELEPVHEALRRTLEPALLRRMAVAAEPVHIANSEVLEAQERAFLDELWARCEQFLRLAQRAWSERAHKAPAAGAGHALLAPLFRQRVRTALRLPQLEALAPTPWSKAARRMLPSESPLTAAAGLWAPVLAWCVLEELAESIDALTPEQLAPDLFDGLRLRQPLAEAFAAVGIEGEEAWKAAARIKALLLAEASKAEEVCAVAAETCEAAAEVKPAKVKAALDHTATATQPALHPLPEAETLLDKIVADEKTAHGLNAELWLDGDVQWLAGLHEAEAVRYVVRESYEELLWWLSLPELANLAASHVQDEALIDAVERRIGLALAEAEAAGYRVDALAGTEPADEADAMLAADLNETCEMELDDTRTAGLAGAEESKTLLNPEVNPEQTPEPEQAPEPDPQVTPRR